MSLYLCPPKGIVPIQKLEEYAMKRLQFLLRLVTCSNDQEVDEVLQDTSVVNQSDCLITNTSKDTISHHILRLVLGGDPESMAFFCDSELAFFKLRVERMLVDEWIVFFKSADRFLCKLRGNGSAICCGALSDLMLVFDVLKEEFESWHHLSAEMCREDNTSVSVDIPFQLVLRLVGRRHVDVHKGVARVPVALFKELFIEQFGKLIVAAAGRARRERKLALGDERILRLAVRLKRTLRAETKPLKHHPEQFPALRLSNLWQCSQMFPPCMANIVKVLLQRHRLKHHDRVQLTLFLKELGLPLNDALLLWKREYSVSTSASINGHGWHGNERRYIYNIRHLYGLEGSRTDYMAHTCSAIQDRALSCGHGGGCPFVCQDNSSIESMCSDYGLDKCNIKHITKLTSQKQYGRACQQVMIHKLKKARKNKESVLENHSERLKPRIDNGISAVVLDNCRLDKTDSSLENTISPGGQINHLLVNSELKWNTNLSPVIEGTDNCSIPTGVTNVKELLLDVNLKHSGHFISFDNKSHLSERLCRVCQKPIIQTSLNVSGCLTSIVPGSADQQVTTMSDVDIDSGKLNRTIDSSSRKVDSRTLESNLNLDDGKMFVLKCGNIHQDSLMTVSPNLVRNTFSDNSHNKKDNSFAPNRMKSSCECINNNNINIKTENRGFEDGDKKCSVVKNNCSQATDGELFQHHDGQRVASNLSSNCPVQIPSSGGYQTINETSRKRSQSNNKIHNRKRYLFKMKPTEIEVFPKRICRKFDSYVTRCKSVSADNKTGCLSNKTLKPRQCALAIKKSVSADNKTGCLSNKTLKPRQCALAIKKSVSADNKTGCLSNKTLKPRQCALAIKKSVSADNKTGCLSNKTLKPRQCALAIKQTGLVSRPMSRQRFSGGLRASSTEEVDQFCCSKSGVGECKISLDSVSKDGCIDSPTFSAPLPNLMDKLNRGDSSLDALLGCGKEAHSDNSVVDMLGGSGGGGMLLSCCSEGSGYPSNLSHVATGGNKLSVKLVGCCRQIENVSYCRNVTDHSSKLSHGADVSGHCLKLSHGADISGHTSINFHQEKDEEDEVVRLYSEDNCHRMGRVSQVTSPGPVVCVQRSRPCWEHSVCSSCQCLECSFNEKPFSPVSEQPVVLTKPSHIYWFCREHCQ